MPEAEKKLSQYICIYIFKFSFVYRYIIEENCATEIKC